MDLFLFILNDNDVTAGKHSIKYNLTENKTQINRNPQIQKAVAACASHRSPPFDCTHNNLWHSGWVDQIEKKNTWFDVSFMCFSEQETGIARRC